MTFWEVVSAVLVADGLAVVGVFVLYLVGEIL